MSQYRGEVFADRWPFRTNVEASNYHTAAHRILTAWEKRFKGSKRPSTITIRIIKGE